MGSAATMEAIEERLSPDLLAAANINPHTRLATDYLNHFNDVVMMLELVPEMPDCAEDVVGWTPMSYPDYFRRSHFRERDLAVLAFERADPDLRAEFEAKVTHLDCAMAEAIDLARTFEIGDAARAHALRDIVAGRLKPLVSELGGLVNGCPTTTDACEVFESEAQAAVDQLFP